MESSTEDNQIHWSVLLDHKMVIEGIQYREKKELQLFCNEEMEWMDGVAILSHMRSIGDRTYTANQKIVDGEVKDVTFKTTILAEDEVADFKKDWENNWSCLQYCLCCPECYQAFDPRASWKLSSRNSTIS